MLNVVRHHASRHERPDRLHHVAVHPGDVLVGDPTGISVVPRHLAAELAADAAGAEAARGVR
jgi:regulator of RNase E activity RraA